MRARTTAIKYFESCEGLLFSFSHIFKAPHLIAQLANLLINLSPLGVNR